MTIIREHPTLDAVAALVDKQRRRARRQIGDHKSTVRMHRRTALSTPRTRTHVEWLADLRHAVGELTAGQRLEWVVEFSQLDIEALGRQALLEVAYTLLALEQCLPAGFETKLPASAMPKAEVRRLQSYVKRGLKVLTARGGDLPARALGRYAWRLPALRVSLNPYEPGRYFWTHSVANQRAAVLYAIAHLLAAEGERLRSCLQCGEPFVRQGRGEYCPGQKCGQQQRDERKAARRLARSVRSRSSVEERLLLQ